MNQHSEALDLIEIDGKLYISHNALVEDMVVHAYIAKGLPVPTGGKRKQSDRLKRAFDRELLEDPEFRDYQFTTEGKRVYEIEYGVCRLMAQMSGKDARAYARSLERRLIGAKAQLEKSERYGAGVYAKLQAALQRIAELEGSVVLDRVLAFGERDELNLREAVQVRHDAIDGSKKMRRAHAYYKVSGLSQKEIDEFDAAQSKFAFFYRSTKCIG